MVKIRKIVYTLRSSKNDQLMRGQSLNIQNLTRLVTAIDRQVSRPARRLEVSHKPKLVPIAFATELIVYESAP